MGLYNCRRNSSVASASLKLHLPFEPFNGSPTPRSGMEVHAENGEAWRWRGGVNRFGRYRRPNPGRRAGCPQSPLFLKRMRAGACFLLFQMSTCAAVLTHLRRLETDRNTSVPPLLAPTPLASRWPASSLTHTVISHRWR